MVNVHNLFALCLRLNFVGLIAKGWHLALLGHLGMHLSGISSWRSQSTQTLLPLFCREEEGKRSLLVYPKNDVKFLLKHHTKGGFR